MSINAAGKNRNILALSAAGRRSASPKKALGWLCEVFSPERSEATGALTLSDVGRFRVFGRLLYT